MTKQPFSFKGISGSTLKLFAIITMLIDHTGATVLQELLSHPSFGGNPAYGSFFSTLYSLSRSIGRLAFPVFCFLLVEGFTHTHNVRKYAGRMFLFALISEIPFDIALKDHWFYPGKQNVYFTLLIGLLVLIAVSWCEKLCSREYAVPFLKNRFFRMLLSFPLITLFLYGGMWLAMQIDTDYNYKGVFLIAALYLTRRLRLYQCLTGALCVAWELPASAGFIPVFLYNGTRGLRMKYFFYWFYPVHLMILYGITVFLLPLL